MTHADTHRPADDPGAIGRSNARSRLTGRSGLSAACAIALTLAACSDGDDASRPDPGPPPSPAPSPANSPPEFTSDTTVSVPENRTDTGYIATAEDADGDSVTFSISGGADGALFSIGEMTGVLLFNDQPDFEMPADGDADNVYLVEIRASDGEGASTLLLQVTVLDLSGTFQVQRVAAGFDQPIFLAGRDDGTGRVLVVERSGKIELLDPLTGQRANQPFLDIRGETTTESERGLLGFALAPDFESSGVFFLNMTNLDGDTEIRRYATAPGDRDRADPASGDVILTVDQPAANHNGGWIGFGNDGMLYIALGDGGGSPSGRAQDPNNLLGKILRIDPFDDGFPNDDDRDYTIPPGNAFQDGSGAPEIWALGLRNPFRASFDRQTGDLWIGDVGQDRIEEVDLAPAGSAGLNFGWSDREGTLAFNGPPDPSFTDPVLEYDHGFGPFQGNSITGGVVYRGPIAELQGQYFYGDFISGNIWSVHVTRLQQGVTLSGDQATQRNADFTPTSGTIDNIAAFGQDADRNLYLIDLDGEIFVVTAE